MEIVPYQRFHSHDKISHLPQELIDNILMRLTTRDAVKTSLLSTEWRYKWTTLKQLIFDDAIWQKPNAVAASAKSEVLASWKIVDILIHVLFHHRGPITKFSLVIPQLKGNWEISEYLVEFLSSYDIEEFVFEIEDHYMIPPELFMYSKLKYVKLSSCYIDLPQTFKGFNWLVKLELYDVILGDEELQKFVSSCPLLEHLVLHVSNEPHLLVFSAPLLKVFLLVCNADYICLPNSPLLAQFSVQRYHVAEYKDVRGTGNLKEFLNSLPALEELFMGLHFMKNLAAGEVQTKLPARLIHLRIIKLSEICLDFLDELSTVFCLIRSSPNLEKLKIEIWRTTIAGASVCNFLKAQDYSDVVLNRLERVKIYSIAGTIPEMELIKLLLKKSLKLKQMVISLWMGAIAVNRVRILAELNSFERASPEAQVIFKV